MTPLQIVLIMIGLAIIIISCFIIDKSQNKNGTAPIADVSIDKLLTSEHKKQIEQKIEDMISQTSDELIVRADDTLSKISNEKIIAVHEFSDQILEKINRNHEEVIFLYNMLTDKEKELKNVVREVETTKKISDSLFQNTVSQPVLPPSVHNQIPPSDTITQADQIKKQSKTSGKKKDNSLEQIKEYQEENNNDIILSLFSQGKSVVEISKELNLGQGEVKLVIDLFRTKK